MYVGMLTAPFGGEVLLDDILDFAAESGFGGLEVAVGKVLDPANLGKPAEIRKKFVDRGLEISSLACYCNVFDGDAARQKQTENYLRQTIDAAAALKVPTVCTLAGLAPAGMSREKCIDELMPGKWKPLLKYAARKKVRIAFENWYATLAQSLAHFERIFSVLGAENVGLNYDPSHLYWMGIDYCQGVEQFADRIFHTHAKDTIIYRHRLSVVGNQGGGWWRYVIPGLGEVDWGRYISCLRSNGYNGTLSIEHEDGSVGVKEGFRIGRKYLSQFID